MFTKIKEDLLKQQRPSKAEFHLRFFKCGKGEYGEGDQFLGVSVPDQRKIAKKYFKEVSYEDVQRLLDSKIHEHRLTGLFLLNYKFEKFPEERKKIYELWIKNTKNINNWDLIDCSAPNVVGEYLLDKDKSLLYEFAKSSNLWKKRISILSTFRFIKNNRFNDTIKIAEILVNDKHDLIHKAVGWMLREVSKKDQAVEEAFLTRYHKTMPRTMLRYAIERFSQEKREYYMKK